MDIIKSLRLKNKMNAFYCYHFISNLTLKTNEVINIPPLKVFKNIYLYFIVSIFTQTKYNLKSYLLYFIHYCGHYYLTPIVCTIPSAVNICVQYKQQKY